MRVPVIDPSRYLLLEAFSGSLAMSVAYGERAGSPADWAVCGCCPPRDRRHGRRDVFNAFQFGFDERAKLLLIEPYDEP
jgi:hypothetical protein